MFPQLGRRCYRSGQESCSVTIIQSLPEDTCQDHLFQRQTLSRQKEIIDFDNSLDCSLNNKFYEDKNPLKSMFPSDKPKLKFLEFLGKSKIQNFDEMCPLVQYLEKKFRENDYFKYHFYDISNIFPIN